MSQVFVRGKVERFFLDKPKDIQDEENLDNTKTNLGGNIGAYKVGKIIFSRDNNNWQNHINTTFSLVRGENVLGRQSNSSDADVQFPTSDKFMSRKHALLNVVMLSNSVFEHRLSDLGSMNGVYCNGIKIDKDDIILLSHNDEIKLGHTILKFIIE